MVPSRDSVKALIRKDDPASLASPVSLFFLSYYITKADPPPSLLFFFLKKWGGGGSRLVT